jgi:hypothetical protein
VLIAGPVILYMLLPLARVPAATASVVVVVIALKHLGLLAALLTPLYVELPPDAMNGDAQTSAGHA